MIYKKTASFPYPILTDTSSNYQNNKFQLDIVSLNENKDNYILKFNYEIGSTFVKNLIYTQKAKLILIIQSKDNTFEWLDPKQTEVSILKSRLSLSSRTTVQLHALTQETVYFKQCEDLSSFYSGFKNDITVQKNSLLGYSNYVVYEGSENKPLQIIERRIDPNLSSTFKVEFGSSTIVLVFKEDKYQLNGFTKNNALMNMYIYIGLSRALNRFIASNIGEEEFIELSSLGEVQSDSLNQKLLDLMLNKGIEEIDEDSIDEVVSIISSNIVEKFVSAIHEVSNYGD